MLFNSYIFVFLFFPICVLGYYGLLHMQKTEAAKIFLIAMSLWFYGYFNVSYLLIMLCSIAGNYFFHRMLSRRQSRMLVAAAVSANLGVLFYFKYFDFFLSTMNAAFGTSVPMRNILLPLGISFFTFQQISFVADTYLGEVKECPLVDYMLFVAFFPQLIAGPIVNHKEMLPQFRNLGKKPVQWDRIAEGCGLFILGLAKKVLLADTFGAGVDFGYGSLGSLGRADAVIVIVSYTLQLYFDFSGYCDMAYGIGYLFNVTLPINFNSPYKAVSIREFWERWHMTLTRFFTKYIYIPLGGSRRGTARTYINVMVVFLVSGIWHGANWTFILWGMVNGLGNLFDRVFDRILRRIPRLIRVLSTFCFCSIAWSMFRAESLEQGFLMIKNLGVAGDGRVYEPLIEAFDKLLEVKLLGWMGLGPQMQACPWLIPAVFAALLVCACLWMRNTQEKVADGRYGLWRIVVTVGLLIWSILSLSEVSEFLYFNF